MKEVSRISACNFHLHYTTPGLYRASYVRSGFGVVVNVTKACDSTDYEQQYSVAATGLLSPIVQ